MAKYIDRKDVVDIIENSADLKEAKSCIYQLLTADVIERSKIDRAIEEISEYASIWTSYTMDMSKEQIAVRCLNDYAAQFLDILKRNIGEQNN